VTSASQAQAKKHHYSFGAPGFGKAEVIPFYEPRTLS
jgi:hypothetical protein